MNAKPEEGRPAGKAAEPRAGGGSGGGGANSGGANKLASRLGLYLVTPVVPGMAADGLTERLKSVEGVEVVKVLARQGKAGEPVVVARMAADKVATLRALPGTLLVEPDEALIAAAWSMADPAVATSAGPGFTTTIHVVGPKDEPLERAEIHLLGQHWAAHGVTGNDGKAQITLFGETPDSVTALIIKPRAGYWSLMKEAPRLQAEGVTKVAVEALPNGASGWAAKALRLDGLPADRRGKGVKVALIDTGVAVSNRQLTKLSLGVDIAGGGDKAWAQDPVGHGTLAAGILAAEPQADGGPRGYAPEAELHVCRIPPEGRISDLVAALDYCLDAGIDLVNLGYGSLRGSVIVERRIETAKRMGMAVVAPVGNRAGAVQFPASSPHVLAVAALGKSGEFPADSPHAASAAGTNVTGTGPDGYFSPAFSATGPEVDVSAPGVAVICCQAPDGIAAVDGTSVAAAHVTAVAALVLAHHPDFRQAFSGRNARRVERLFQIIKETAQPLALDPRRAGAGLPDAARALGLTAGLEARPPVPVASRAPLGGLEAMRAALQLAGVTPAAPGQVARGPAVVTHAPLTSAELSGAGLTELRAAMAQLGLRPLY